MSNTFRRIEGGTSVSRSAMLLLVLALWAGPGNALLAPDDILVTDLGTSGGGPAIYGVDPETGERTILSGCADATCTTIVGGGPEFIAPDSIAFEPDGNVLVTDLLFRALFRVDPKTGDRSILSGCAGPSCGSLQGTGPTFGDPRGVVVQASGIILVVDRVVASMSASRVIAVEPATGDRVVFSGCLDPACASSAGTGFPLTFADSIALEADGNLLVSLATPADVFRIDAMTGNRSVAANGGGPFLGQARGLFARANRDIFVADISAEALYLVDAIGNRSIFSGCLDGACTTEQGSGPSIQIPNSVAEAFGGRILVLNIFPPAVLEIDPLTGDRVTLSGCMTGLCTGEVGSGESFHLAARLAVVPTPETSIYDFESDTPGSPPGGFTAIGGNVTVQETGEFTGIANPASAGTRFAYLTTGPNSTGAGSSGVDVTGDGDPESDVASLFVLFVRAASDPVDLAFDFNVLTDETDVADPFAVWLDGALVVSGAIEAANGSFPAVSGFDGSLIEGPDTSTFDEGQRGYRTIRIADVSLGLHALHFFVADESDAVVDTALLVDNVRFVPEPGWVGLLAPGMLLLLALHMHRNARSKR